MQGWSWSEIVRVFTEKFGVFLMMALFVVAATALYGPQAAALVELFPTRIRYTALSLPYHIGTGWFGGLLPAIVFAINTATGQINAGLWFPVIVTAIAATVTLLLLAGNQGSRHPRVGTRCWGQARACRAACAEHS